VACKGERKNAYRVVVGKPEGKRSHKKPLKRWEFRWGQCVGWIHLIMGKVKWWAVANV
jgi:hypothetical protein